MIVQSLRHAPPPSSCSNLGNKACLSGAAAAIVEEINVVQNEADVCLIS